MENESTNRKTVGRLLERITHEDENVRKEAAECLVKMGTTAFKPVCAALEAGNWTAAWILGEIGDVRAVKILKSVLHHNDWRVRGDAALSLGKLGAEDAIPELELLLSDENKWVRQDVTSALASLSKLAQKGKS